MAQSNRNIWLSKVGAEEMNITIKCQLKKPIRLDLAFLNKNSINLCIAAHEFSNDYVVVDGMSCPSFFDSLLPFFFDRIEKFICYSTVCTQNTRLFPVLTVVSIRGCVQRVVFFPASCVWVNLVNLFQSICPHYFIVWYTVHEELHSTQKRWEFQSDTNRTCTIDQKCIVVSI